MKNGKWRTREEKVAMGKSMIVYLTERKLFMPWVGFEHTSQALLISRVELLLRYQD